jgi:hypothetical protein
MIPVLRSLAASLCSVTLCAASLAFAQDGAWVVFPEEDPFSPVGLGAAYVEPFSHPDTVQQSDTGLVVACDPAAPDGYELYVWIGAHPMPAKDPRAGTIEVLTRRDADEVRTTLWSVVGSNDTVVLASERVRELLMDDLRRGGVLSLRVLTDPPRGALQPTFQFDVDGFAAVEAALACAEVGRRASQPAPTDPAPPAGAEPGGGFSGSVAGLTNLLTYGTLLADFAPLPEAARVHRVSATGELVSLVSGDGDAMRAVVYQCSPEGGENRLATTLVSPSIPEGAPVYLVLFDQGREIGFVQGEGLLEDGSFREAFLLWDEDEEGLLTALLLYGDLDALLLDADDRVLDAWRISARGFATAVNALPCR